MSKHSPGPWTWAKHNCGLYNPTGEVLSWAPYEGMWLAFCDQEEANGRLIAAAPELLEALKALVDAPLRYNDKRIEIDCPSHSFAMEMVRTARAAIDKATGGT